MITAVDTNVLLDVFGADEQFGIASREALRRCRLEGCLVACEVVWAETAACFDSSRVFDEQMDALEIAFSEATREISVFAGSLWKDHLQRGGRRGRLVPDFLIGAHARFQADRLLTRDRGFYRTYFRQLTVVDPADRTDR